MSFILVPSLPPCVYPSAGIQVEEDVDVENVLDDDVIHNVNERNEDLDFYGKKPPSSPDTAQSRPQTPGHSEESKVRHIPKNIQEAKRCQWFESVIVFNQAEMGKAMLAPM